MFRRIWFLIDKDDWLSKLAEVLVGFKHSTMPNSPTDRIFQTSMSGMIVEVYLESIAGMLYPLHSCWVSTTPILLVYNRVASALQYVF